MSPTAIILDIAILVGIVGIIVYWVRRFAVFRGYKDLERAVLQIASVLETQAIRDRRDVVVGGHFRNRPTIVRFSRRMDTPGLEIQMRAPVTFDLWLMPRTVATSEGRVILRSGSTELDKRFSTRTNFPAEARMHLADSAVLASLEQLCCSTQTGLAMSGQTIQLSELTIPDFTANHVMDHLHAMAAVAERLDAMPGADQIKIQPLSRLGSTWTIRVTLVAGLIGLVILLFAQPYNRPSAEGRTATHIPSGVGVLLADAPHIQKLQGWHVAWADDFSGVALRFLRERRLPLSGRVTADFTGHSQVRDSAYLLLDASGQRRLVMLAGGMVAYDVIFPRVDLIAAIPHRSLPAIEWSAAPQFAADGDALLVVQNAEDPTQSVVLLRHGPQTYSARPADFNKIDLIAP
ncbi:MAG TPA: hypothetical protein VIX19_10740 [Terriglobales bacterium]